jgi:hypothetical protein
MHIAEWMIECGLPNGVERITALAWRRGKVPSAIATGSVAMGKSGGNATSPSKPESLHQALHHPVNHRLMPDTELMEFVCEERDATHYLGKK